MTGTAKLLLALPALALGGGALFLSRGGEAPAGARVSEVVGRLAFIASPSSWQSEAG